MQAVLENLTTNEAAIAAGVSVADINLAIDRKILSKNLYSVTDNRTVARKLVSGLPSILRLRSS